VRQEIHRQPLLFGFHDRLTAADIKDNLTVRQPVGSLLEISRDENVGFGKQAGNEVRPQSR
jgi:hypothetical protein